MIAMKTIGKAFYNGEKEFEIKADVEGNKIIQMQPDGVHEGMVWDSEIENEEDAKEAAKIILESNEGMKFYPN